MKIFEPVKGPPVIGN